MKAQISNTVPLSLEAQHSLIEGCKRGDQKSQLQVYKLYYKSVYTICLRVVNDPATAEDIMHESFLSAFEDINSYTGNMSFASWLSCYIKFEPPRQS